MAGFATTLDTKVALALSMGELSKVFMVRLFRIRAVRLAAPQKCLAKGHPIRGENSATCKDAKILLGSAFID